MNHAPKSQVLSLEKFSRQFLRVFLNLEVSLIKIKLVRNEIGFVIQTKVTSYCHVIEAPIPMSRESCVTWNIKFILECPEEKVAETGCLASDLYVFKTCKNRERKPAKEINGFYPHGTSCGNVMCSKQFFGFTWKTKTTKIVCECNNGRCGWSKPLHKCPTGLIYILVTDFFMIFPCLGFSDKLFQALMILIKVI